MKPFDSMTAEDLMSSPVVALNAETSLADAARTLTESEISGALVTDHRDAPVGVVSLFDIVAHMAGNEAVVQSARGGELRFQSGGDLVDLRGGHWSLEGDRRTLDLAVSEGRMWSDTYPDALGRLWSALQCPRAGDVLVSARPGYEFVDWGGADHVGGGSHGALHRGDSLGVLIMCGTGPGSASERLQWTIRDAVPTIREHFSIH